MDDLVPHSLDDRSALVLEARAVAGRAAMVVRSVGFDGLGAAAPGDVAIFDRKGRRAGVLLGGALDAEIADVVARILDDPVEASQPHLVELPIDTRDAEAAGFTCAGLATVVVQPVDHVPAAWWDALATHRPVALLTDLDLVGHGATVDLAHPDLARGVTRSIVEEHDDRRRLVELQIPVTRVVVVGTAALADELVALAAWLEWRPTHADAELARAMLPSLGPRDAIIVLDHALATTGPLLADALRASVGYVGALGSRRTQTRRAEHLQQLGVHDDELARLHGPAGLDLGPTTAREIALSILAEMAAVRSQRTGSALRDGTDPVMR